MGCSVSQAELQQSRTLPMSAPHFPGRDPQQRSRAGQRGLTPLQGFGMRYRLGAAGRWGFPPVALVPHPAPATGHSQLLCQPQAPQHPPQTP